MFVCVFETLGLVASAQLLPDFVTQKTRIL